MTEILSTLLVPKLGIPRATAVCRLRMDAREKVRVRGRNEGFLGERASYLAGTVNLPSTGFLACPILPAALNRQVL